MRTDTPKEIFLKDYSPPAFLVRHVDLSFDIRRDKTRVTAVRQFIKKIKDNQPLFLDGETLKFISCKLDGKDVQPDITDHGLTLPCPAQDEFTLEIVTEIVPEQNTALEGLYYSGGTYCTQCEAQGFRRITYFPDRPDILSTYRVRIEGDEALCPVLLSNGNLLDSGKLANGRHYTVWDDPTPKPCYLFALVAGDLQRVSDHFTTQTGTPVDLHIYVRKGDEGQCAHAMESLKKSMKWDEEVYGRIYQYNIFNIVAVSDFNMGAMENTSLNIFNTALVLAYQDTATDADFMRVESVIAHEYFHNWTGNRVTCRDWFQLSLKEGLTVFRDQEFSADLNSRAVQRIDDVCHLRRHQFPEDASPLSHPVRPESYIEINNFYTMTVYEKGAEVIRMFHTLLGADTYRKATDLYFDRFDGQAVTIDDWAQCMEDASGLDLSQFKLWYSISGTPQVKTSYHYDAQSKIFTLTLEQSGKIPMHIPVAVGLLDRDGHDLIGTKILHLKEASQDFIFENIEAEPVPSLLRNFSAPIILKTEQTIQDFAFLMVHDTDGFNQWEAAQSFGLHEIKRCMAGEPVSAAYLDSIQSLLNLALDQEADTAFLARMMTPPAYNDVALASEIIDPQKISDAIKKLKSAIKAAHKPLLEKIYAHYSDVDKGFQITPEAMGRRALRNAALLLLTATKGTGCAALAMGHYDQAQTMTDRMAALSALLDNPAADRERVLKDFYTRFHAYPLVMDKWFALQASAERDDIFDDLQTLRDHSDFSMTNPNRVRSLYGAFANNNPVKFHDPSGQGYAFLKDGIIELNAINPQIAARMVTPFREWKRFTANRQEMMKAALEDILALPDLSPNVYELVKKSLDEQIRL